MESSNQRVSLTRDGFVLFRRRWIWYRPYREVNWDEVSEIKAVMWDCCIHVSGFRLILSDGTSVCYTDMDDGWDEFKGRIHDVFPEINSEVVERVEQTFPDEIELTCWTRPDAIQAGKGRESGIALPDER